MIAWRPSRHNPTDRQVSKPHPCRSWAKWAAHAPSETFEDRSLATGAGPIPDVGWLRLPVNRASFTSTSAKFSQKVSTFGPRVELVAERLRRPAGASGLLVALLFEQHWEDDKCRESKHDPDAQPDSSEVFPRKHKAFPTQRRNSNADPAADMHHSDGISQVLISS